MQSRFLLRPGPEANAIIKGVIGPPHPPIGALSPLSTRLGRLLFSLLEPRSEDLVAWNSFDRELEDDSYPVLRGPAR